MGQARAPPPGTGRRDAEEVAAIRDRAVDTLAKHGIMEMTGSGLVVGRRLGEEWAPRLEATGNAYASLVRSAADIIGDSEAPTARWIMTYVLAAMLEGSDAGRRPTIGKASMAMDLGLHSGTGYGEHEGRLLDACFGAGPWQP